MPSRAEARVLFERVLRGIVIVALAVLLWQSLRDRTDFAGRSVAARGGALSGSLSEWSIDPLISSIGLHLESIPPGIERAWLGALAAAGSRLTWSGDIAPTMIDAQPIASPAAGTSVRFAAPNGVPVVLRDEVGVIDTVSAQRHGVAVVLGSVTNQLTASVGGSVASAIQSDSAVLRRILVIGNAGWESKFVVAALDEAGWKVDALIRVGPNVDVAQGSVTLIDTARYSAVIALDGGSLPYARQIVEFAQTGGGVVLSPQASRIAALALLRSGAVSRAAADRPGPALSAANPSVLSLSPITSLRDDATAIESQSGAVAAAARRVGAGRALQIAYEDTWRWRMSGDDVAVRRQREWWTELVSSVAHSPRIARGPTVTNTDEAPFVHLAAAIGRGSGTRNALTQPGRVSEWMIWVFALLTITLVGEVMSRRLRGIS